MAQKPYRLACYISDMAGEKEPRKYDYGPFGTEMPTGSRFLSPAFETAQRSMIGRSAYEALPYWEQAIAELRQLNGGEDAYEEVMRDFQDKNHRKLGDTNARVLQMARDFPNMETWRLTPDNHADFYVDDIRQIAYVLSRKFDGENNPRTPEFVHRISEEYKQLADKAHASFKAGHFSERLPHDVTLGVGPTSADQEHQQQEYIEEYGKSWDEMEENDFYERPSAVYAALRYVPGYIDAQRVARNEWDLLRPLLGQVRAWHRFDTDEDNYVMRRINTLLGQPLNLKSYEQTDKALGYLTPSTVLGMDCEAVLDFVRLFDIPDGEYKAWGAMRDALEYYLDDIKGTVKKKVEAMKLSFYDDPEQYVRELNSRVNYGLRLWRKPRERR